MKNIILVLLTMSLFSACGDVDLTGKKLEKEEKKTKQVSEDLESSNKEKDNFKEMIKNLSQTTTLQWVYVASSPASMSGSYESAEKTCKSVGFDLPTSEQLAGGEAQSLQVLMRANRAATTSFDDLTVEDVVYTKGSTKTIKDSPFLGLFLLCVRPIPSPSK